MLSGSRDESNFFLMTLFNHLGVRVAYSTDITTDKISAKMCSCR